MGLLKRLTAITPKSVIKTNNDNNSFESFEDRKKTYHKNGFDTSRSCQGSPDVLKTSFDAIYHKFENQCKVDEFEQEKLMQPYKNELKCKQTELLNQQDDTNNFENEIRAQDEKIETLKKQIIDVKDNPEPYVEVSKGASAKFWIGLLFLAPLSAYIFIFYVSTSFSAFFKEFDPNVSLFSTILAPEALEEALNKGILELGFICFIPFVFFGLGYIIHMFQQKKHWANYLKIGLLLIVNFIFDALLAYLIDEKIYNLNKTINDQPFDLSHAFTDANFWVIIFAGFVSYLIWGLVFDFVMHEYEERDKIKSFIKQRREEIKNHTGIIDKVKVKLDDLRAQTSKLNVRIAELQNIIDGFILPIRNYKVLSAEYLQGWQEYIASGLAIGKDENDALLQGCREMYDRHIKDLELDVDNYQNKVYTKTL